MAGRIPDETLQAIRDRTSLVEVVSAYVSLKRAGRNHLGLCPFHGEKTPSFTVNEERGLFHCFGCGAGGTVFHFLMRIERLEFPEAVEQLAKRAGIALPERGASDPAAALRERLWAANAEAATFFQRTWQSAAGTAARHYLTERGVKPEAVERYGIGFAPAGGNALAAWLAGRKVAPDVSLQAGLLARRASDGGVYDRFRGRVMFPIRDRRGRVIAFGGRALGSEQPKYLNSPETPVFHKGEGLYGIAEARDAIRASDRAVLVEGYLDAVLLAQEGVPYTVATLGTALTVAQLRQLQPLGGDQLTLFFCFDGDQAGRKAAERAFAVCAEAGVWGRAVFLPDGFDPDSFIRSQGRAAFDALLDAAPPLPDFYFDRVAPSGATLPERVRAAEDVKRILTRVSSDVQFEMLARQAAARLGVDEEIFRRARRAVPSAPPATAQPVEVAPPKWPAAERALIEAMAVDATVAARVAERGCLELFTDADLAQAGARLIDAWQHGRAVGEVVEALPQTMARHLTAVLLGSGPLGGEMDRSHLVEDLVARLESDAERRQRRPIAAALRQAERSGDEASTRAQLETLNELRRRQRGAG